MITFDGEMDWLAWASRGGLSLLGAWLLWTVMEDGSKVLRRIEDWWAVRQLRKEARK